MYNNYEILLGGLQRIGEFDLENNTLNDLASFIVTEIGETQINFKLELAFKQTNKASFLFNLYNGLKAGSDLERSLWDMTQLSGLNIKDIFGFIYYIHENKEDLKDFNSEEILEYHFYEYFE